MAWSLLQGSIMPGPAETVFAPLGLADPRRAYYLAGFATIGATIGGMIAFIIGAELFDTVGRPLISFLGVSDARIESTQQLFERKAWLVVALSTVTPLSTKMVSMFAGAFGMPFGLFVLALALGRAARFFALAMLIRLAGDGLRRAIQRRFGAAPEEVAERAI